MTEDVRDAAREPQGGAETPADPETVTPAEGGAGAVEFAAETMSADRLTAGPEAPDYKDRWLRAEAELQNSRRRAARDLGDAVRSAEDRILVELIELLDDLERALAALAPAQGNEAWAQGVALTAQRMREVLARRGVTPIVAVGRPFDPALHEALLEVPPPDGVAPGSVAQEVQKGYQRGERALRPARVVVARAAD